MLANLGRVWYKINPGRWFYSMLANLGRVWFKINFVGRGLVS